MHQDRTAPMQWIVVRIAMPFPTWILLATACSLQPECGNRVVREVAAPGGAHRAVLFERNCGATTGFSTQVSVLARGEALEGSGNAFIADTDHGRAPAAHGAGPWVELRWIGPGRLLVTHDATARVLVRKREVAGVRIDCWPVEREPE